jgi:hypothetical protein
MLPHAVAAGTLVMNTWYHMIHRWNNAIYTVHKGVKYIIKVSKYSEMKYKTCTICNFITANLFANIITLLWCASGMRTYIIRNYVFIRANVILEEGNGNTLQI